MSLADVTDARLRALLGALADGRIAGVSDAQLAPHGFADLSVPMTPFAALDSASLQSVLGAILEERARHSRASLELVWTGPEPDPSLSRDTAVVVHDLFVRAERHILVAGFEFTGGDKILQPLHAALVRGVRAEVFLNVKRGSPPRSVAQAIHEDFVVKNWPFGPPLPALYYDPRCEVPQANTILHAKCVVVDERFALITSANFTRSGHNRNIELGVLIDDPAFARDVLAQWQRLVNDGMLLRHR